MDILQDVAVSAAPTEDYRRTSRRDGGGAVAPAAAVKRGRGRQEGDGEGEEEEEVVSLRLVGLGMQLHSKSYGARCSFSLQDLDLEVDK